MPPNRIIIDTDPGVDDVLAMLLALSAKPEELEVLMLSVTYGNVDAQNCLRNVITMFQYIEKERVWRRENGKPEGFETLMASKPIVAVGAVEPLAEQMMVADFFHGIDGLGGIHHSHPHLTPAATWESLFTPTPEKLSPEAAAQLQEVKQQHSLFTPSLKPAHEEMLQILKDNEPDTVTIVAIGPLTNLATAAATDPETFLRVKEVVVMGGAVEFPGNPPVPKLERIYSLDVKSISVPNFNLIKQPDTQLRRMLNERNQMTPGGEFNVYADSVAAARVFALTSPNPKTTLPPTLEGKGQLKAYPEKLPRQLKLKLFPLDITEQHLLYQKRFNFHSSHKSLSNSPLATWSTLFLTSTFRKIFALDPSQDESDLTLQLHDPLTIWYCLTADDSRWKFKKNEDIRVETAGQWTRGCCIVDKRSRREVDETGDIDTDVVGDANGWRDSRKGNRVDRCVESPGTEAFAGVLLGRVFGEVD